MNTYLRQLSTTDGIIFYTMLQDIGKEENAFTNPVYGMSFEEYKCWLIQQDNWSKGIKLPPGYVRQTIFWLMDGDVPVGIGKIRHLLTDSSRKFGGNIGYAIASKFRGRGYGSNLLRELLRKADELGVEEKILTVEKNNYASKRVIEHNDGILFYENEKRWFYKFETMKYYINPNIMNTPRVFPKQGRGKYHRYDANENTEGLPKQFVDSVLSELTPEYLAMYPEPERVISKYANYLNIGKDNVYCTNGSDHGIRVLLETFGEQGKEVVTVSPTFEIYWVCCSLLGLKHKAVAYNNDYTISIENILNSITIDTRIVVLLNPNSPIGNLYNESEVQQVINKAKDVNAIVIIDEAYHYFYDKTFLQFAIDNDNVVLLRTFSKLMSIAGLRVGMIIGHKDIIHWVRNSRLAYEMNCVGLLFAERILDHPEIIEQLIAQEKEGKAFLIEKLKKNNYWYMDCHGNYVLIKPKHNAHEVARRLEVEERILVHTYGNEIMKDLLRVSIGSRCVMDFFVKAFFKIENN